MGLLIDDRDIEGQSGVTRVVTPPTKLPEPVVTGPEDKNFQPYMTVLRDPNTERFRIWYGVPESATQSHLATMESDDGIHWRRPHRVLVDPGRIQFGASVVYDDGQYHFAYWDDGGLQIARSADGLTWKKLAPGPVLRHDHDINNVYRDPIRRRYVANVSMYQTGEAWSGKRRVTWQSVSDDLIRWSKPHRIVAPDARDEGETQFYAMGGVIARGGLLIGMARVLRDDLEAGIGYTTLCWSRDGETWERDRTPFLDRSATPLAWDHAMAWADCQLPVGETLHLYYGGYRRGHKVERFTERQIGLATLPLDRYVARRAGANPGSLTTAPFTLIGSALTLNAALREPMTVEVLDDRETTIRGLTARVSGDGVALPVRFRSSLARSKGRSVRLRFTWRSGDLWAFNQT